MSARAASRLETLGFRQVYRYQPGKADWFAAGLPREGQEAHTLRVADIARREVPTCRIDERVDAVHDRMREGAWDVCVVVDEQRVVLGLVHAGTLDVDPATPIEQVMQSSPVTFRPNLRVRQAPDYLKTQRTPRALVTTSDGFLVGLLRVEDVEGQRAHAGSQLPPGSGAAKTQPDSHIPTRFPRRFPPDSHPVSEWGTSGTRSGEVCHQTNGHLEGKPGSMSALRARATV